MLTDLLHRLRALVDRSAVEREIDEELHFHLERQADAYEKAGLDRAEAMRRARIDFGGLEPIKEERRDALGVRLIDDVTRDVRLAIRSLRSTPAMTTVALLSLALVIGANTAIFSILNSLVLRSLPVRDPARLVHVTDSVLRDTGEIRVRAWAYPAWEQIRERPQLFEAATAWSFVRFDLSSGGETDFVDGMWADGTFFQTLGVPAAIGRTFSPADDRPGGGPDGPVAVMGFGYWQRHFGGAADAIGRTVRLNGVPFTIIGVTPPDFFGLEVGRSFDVIVPLQAEKLLRGRDSVIDSASSNFLTIVARLRPGQTLDAAAAELRRVQPEIRDATLEPMTKEATDRYLASPFTVVPAATGFSYLRSDYQRPLMILAAIVALVLLVGSVNVANLLLARAIGRRHELGMRLALGASRVRLVRQLLTESLTLSIAGAGVGLFIATYGSAFLVHQLSTPGRRVVLDAPLDGRVLGFTVAVAIVTSLLFGTLPAFRTMRFAPMDALKSQGRTPADHTRSGLMGWLMGVQVALSVVLVVAAGLFIRSFTSLTHRNLGLQADRVLVVAIDATRSSVDPGDRIPLYERVRETVLRLPDAADAALSFLTPVGGGGFTPPVALTGNGESIRLGPDGDVFGNLISPGWFGTYGTRVISGRDFSNADRHGAPRVAIVNEAFAKQFLGPGSPIGRTITVLPNMPRPLPAVIVGVAEDAIYGSPLEPVPPTWFLPLAQFDVPEFPLSAMRLSVRARAGAPALLTKSVADAITSVDPHLALTPRVLGEQIGASLLRERLMAQLAGFLGGLTLLLAALGLYGVTAYAVSRQRTEIAIRMALGAASGRTIGLLLGRVSLVVGAGLAAGVVISIWAARFVEGLIYDLAPRDPATLGTAVVVLGAIAAVATWLPARRAARMDPLVVLRES